MMTGVFEIIDNSGIITVKEQYFNRNNTECDRNKEGDSMDSDTRNNRFDTVEEVEKFNPYHDSKGRFATAGGATQFTLRTKDPSKQHMADAAIAREKEKHKEEMVQQARQRRADERAAQQRANAELDERVKQELPGLSQDAIRRANDVSMFNHGSVAAREALKRMDDYRERNKPKDDWTDEQKEYAKQREEEYKQLLTEYYNDSNNRYANNPSWAITGPANYNVRAHDKKMQAAHNKAQEYEEKLSRFEENTNKRIASMDSEAKQIAYWRNGKYKSGETISSDDPLAEKKLQAKLDYMTESQANMKAANAYYRKNGSMQGFTGFNEATNNKIDSIMQENAKRGYKESQPFASYSLSNNNAQIKATQSRLKQIQSNREKATASGNSGSSGNRTFNGGQVVANTDINRLQIKFDSVPDAATRQKLKSNGWRWSPKEGAWQRQLTSNAERDAERFIESLGRKPQKGRVKTPKR